MNQEGIWDYFQNEGGDAFVRAGARTMFLVQKLSTGERVLNIGVGVGQLERAALAKGTDIFSLDPGERSISALRENLGMGERAKVGYSQAIPFPDKSFDTVVMSEVIEHLDEETGVATMAEVRRVLKDGGRLIGTVPAREVLEESAVICPHCDAKFHRWGHQRTFDCQTMIESIGAGFSTKASEHFFINWEGASWPRRIGGLLKQFLSRNGIGPYGAARNIYFEAVKIAS